MAMSALVIGLGGTGAHILTRLKDLTVVKHGGLPEDVEFLLLDTVDAQTLGSGVAAGVEVNLDLETEYLHLSDRDPTLKFLVHESLVNAAGREPFPHLKNWLHAPWMRRYMPDSLLGVNNGVAQQRQIGRFAMFQNVEPILQKISLLLKWLSRSARGSNVNVWLVTSSVGCTGAGCFIDVAYLTRLASSRMGVNITISGVVVLPSVYAGIPGVSCARAYSLFRELERVQDRSNASDLFVEHGETVFSQVVYYDRPGKQIVARVPNRLFDNLFYLGRECPDGEDRKRFFGEVANAMEPYMDDRSGPELLRASINTNAEASSFGAARLYVPLETYATIFAQEEIMGYLERVAVPRMSDDQVVGVHVGSMIDRQAAADGKLRGLLALFDNLLDHSSRSEHENQLYARNTLSADTLINSWYGFGSTVMAEIALTPAEEQAVKLTYVNPFISLIEPRPDEVELNDQETKTFKENRWAKGGKESQEESRERFTRELDAKLQQYINEQGGRRTFKQGRTIVLEKVSELLKRKIDRIILNELDQADAFAADARSMEQGTALTRLHRELVYLLEDAGPLNMIDRTVGVFVDTLRSIGIERRQRSMDAVKKLREARKKPGWFSGTWVEAYQKVARDEMSEYVAWYQKHELLRDMQQLMRIAKDRFAAWEKVFQRILNRLILDEEGSVFHKVSEDLAHLKDQLYHIARDPIARISCARFDPKNPDMDMQGYRHVLRNLAVGNPEEGQGSLAQQALMASRWMAEVKPNGMPELSLVLTTEVGSETIYTSETVHTIHQDLYADFRQKIDPYLQNTDIFDYLLYLQHEQTLDTDYVVRMLNDAAEVMINAGYGNESCKLVYRDPVTQAKSVIAQSIQLKLSAFNPAVSDPETQHSDRNSITVLRIKMPDTDEMHDLMDCKREYIRLQYVEPDYDVLQAQVYHPFRQELEAWFIERFFRRKYHETSESRYYISPRIVRLLEDPAMMQAFVHCVATGAVEKLGHSWVWHNTTKDQDVILTEADNEPKADLIRAAVVFVLQKREGRRGGLIPIKLDEARQSAVDMAQQNGSTKQERINHFIEHELDTYLDTYHGTDKIGTPEVLERQRLGLRMIFEFYADPETRTDFEDRLSFE